MRATRLIYKLHNKSYEVASRPTAGRLGDVQSDRQSVVLLADRQE